MGTVLKKRMSKLTLWFQEFLKEHFSDGVVNSQPLDQWFNNQREDLEGMIEMIENKNPAVPSKDVFRAILFAKKIELVDEPLNSVISESGYESLKIASSVLLAKSKKLDKNIPLEGPTWTDIAGNLLKAGKFLEKVPDHLKVISGWGSGGGQDPLSHQNFMIYLVRRAVKKSTGKKSYELVADILVAAGYPLTSSDAVRKRVECFEETWKRLTDRVLKPRT